jgi:CHAD domain-containing protein
MSYQLRWQETPGEGLQRICRKQIELALDITSGSKEAKDTPVHDTRRHLKKARAVMRLVRKEIGRALFKKHDHALRNVGRLISEIRDAEVRLQTVRELQSISGRQRRRSFHQLEQMLTLELENFIAAFAEWQGQAIPMMEEVRDSIACWPVDQFGLKQLRCAVQSTYKKGRNALAEAKRAQTAECFHVFRKHTKQLGYQLRILRPAKPVVLKNLNDDLRALGNLLGRAHDLSFLGDRLRQEPDKADWQRDTRDLLAVIEASQSDLQRGAADLAERFYAQRPRDFGTRLAAWLDQWSCAEHSSVADALVDPVRSGGRQRHSAAARKAAV